MTFLKCFSRKGLLGSLFLLTLSKAGATQIPSQIEGVDLVTQHKLSWSLPAKDKKPTVILFMSSRCPCSMGHEEALSQLAKDFATDAHFVAVLSNIDETASAAAQHFQERKVSFPVILDSRLKWADALGATNTPQVFVISGNSRQVVFHGGISNTHKLMKDSQNFFLKDALSDLRAGQAPRLAEAKTLGCYIKRKLEPQE